MARAAEVPRDHSQKTADPSAGSPSGALAADLVTWLDDAKAENIVTIDIKDKSSIGDFMIVASGRTDRHVGAIADQLREKLRENGHANVRLEGQPQCDWVLVDAGEVIVHVLRPEVREFYNLEKMWMADRPADVSAH
jgi:ribosome-associated protein